jgi:DNA modification methylase
MIVNDLTALAVDIDRLQLLPGNPRRGDVDAVARSLAAFGQRKPIVALRDGTVIAGNHTLQAARSLSWDKIAVVWVDDDDTTAKAFALADNRTAELGGYDEVALAELIAAVQEADEELLGATGWTGQDLSDLLAEIGAGDVGPSLTDPDAVPDSAPSKTVVGDVWILGDHRVMCGDSTSPSDIETLMAGGHADMVWTDPPYGVSYVGKTDEALTLSNDGSDEYISVMNGAFDSMLAACRPGAAVYVAAPAGPRGIPFALALQERDIFRQRLVWVKSSMVLGHSDYHYRHEDIYFGYIPGYKGRVGRGGNGWYGDNSQTSVLEFAKPSANRDHPTMKPVDLIAYCISNSSAPKNIVLDLFGGSGSTLMASQLTGRHARLMELDPHYVDVICRRFQEHTGIAPIAEATGREHDFTES